MLEYHLLEKKPHGSSNFPFDIYTVKYPVGNQIILPLHWHEEIEIIYVRSGDAVFTINHTEYAVQAGDCVIVNSGELHGGYSHNPDGCTYIAIVFKLSWLSSLHPDICQDEHLNPLLCGELLFPTFLSKKHKQDLISIDYIEQMISDYMEGKEGISLRVKGRLFLLIAALQPLLIPKQSDESTASNKKKWKNMMRVLAHIDQNYKAPLSLDELASIGAMSPSHMCRLFKELTGMRPIEYIQLLRVNSAALMLQNDDCKILDAALENGFQHVSYFSKQFRKYKGMSPSEYKKNSKQITSKVD